MKMSEKIQFDLADEVEGDAEAVVVIRVMSFFMLPQAISELAYMVSRQ